MAKRRYLLAYEGVTGSGNVAEFSSAAKLSEWRKGCEGGTRRITAKELRSAEFKYDDYHYVS